MQITDETAGALVPVAANSPQLLTQTSQDTAVHQKIAKVRYWQILRRKRVQILSMCALGGLLGFALTLLQVPTYQARTTIEVEGQNEPFPNMKDSDPSYGSSGDSPTDIQTQIAILRSKSLLRRVVIKMGASGTSTDDTLSLPRLGMAMYGRRPNLASAVALAVKSIEVRPTPGTRIIDISIDSTIPNVAANFANTLVNEFIEQNIDTKWQESLRRAEWLSQQLNEMRVKIDRSESNLQQYAKEAGLLFTNDKTSVAEDRLRQVQQTLSSAQADRIAKQSRFEMLSAGPADSVPDILDDDNIRGYLDKLADLRRQIADLGIIYTPENAKMRSLQAQIFAVESSYKTAREMIGARIRSEYDESLRKERMTKADYVDQSTRVLGEGEKTLQYNILKGEVDSNRQLYDTMLQQLKQSSIASAMRASNIRTVDSAEIPGGAYKPNITRSIVIGNFLGLFSAIGFVLLRERTNQTIRDIGETADFLGIPELGIIPSAKLVAQHARKHPTRKARRHFPFPLSERVELSTWQLQQSIVAESFRSTLVSILLSSSNIRKAHRFVVISASPHEGKTTVACNLGSAMAEMGDLVLLVDGDLRKPRLHSIFGLDEQPGLSDLFNELTNRKGAVDISKYVRATSVPRLFLLTAGKSTSSSTSLLYGKLLREVLELVQPGFDKIFIDTPPMLEIPDARVIAKQANCVILVVRAGLTTRDSVIAAYNQFLDDGTELLGAVVNDWNPADSSAGYYGYGYGYYGRHYATRPYGTDKDDQTETTQ